MVDWEASYDDAPCGLLITAPDGGIRFANLTLCRWLGVEREELVGKRRFQDLLTMGGRIFHQTHWAPLLHMQGSVAEVKLDLAHRDGHPIPVVLNARVRERHGVVSHELALFVATDRHAYERELLLARKRAEELLVELGHQRSAAENRASFAEQMIGIVSHDLRNPLSTIALGTQLLERTNPSAAQAKVQGNISRAAARALTMVGDLLDFTRARIGEGLLVEAKPVDLHAFVAGCVEELALAHPSHKLVHERRGAGEAWADADRLCQLIGNLTSNAVAYGSPDAPVSVISLIEVEHAMVTVHNTGPVIPPDAMAALFQPMVRGTDIGAASRSVGLGLYIVSQIACAHGGTVEVTSTEEGGTAFSVKLPSRQVEASRPDV